MFKKFEYKSHYPGLIQAWKVLAFAALISVLMMFPLQSVQAAPAESVVENPQPAERIAAPVESPPEISKPSQGFVKNPPSLGFRKTVSPATTPSDEPLATKETNVEKQFDLDVDYTVGKLLNPAKLRVNPTDPESLELVYDKVRLRSYVDHNAKKKSPDVTPTYVAPTIEVKPGDTVRISLTNKLKIDPSCTDSEHDINKPHCFNGTNLHSHGLWISPTGNSDNVLESINPGVNFQYEYNIPVDHPSGTFWYHPHRHGSTALQVSSGMVGALIVRGDRLPTLSKNGDIDTLLKKEDGQSITERILVLQQIQYYCPNSKNLWQCDDNDTGVIESYNNFGPSNWRDSGRYTSINGEIIPSFLSNSGSIERWRMIHGGLRDTITLEFRKLRDQGLQDSDLSEDDPKVVLRKILQRLKPQGQESYISKINSYIENECTGKTLPYHVIADDGLTRSQARKTTLTTLQPGYRSDALVVFPEPGLYCVIDAPVSGAGSVTRKAEGRGLLGIVHVRPGEQVSNIPEYLKTQLVAAAERTMPQQVKDKVVSDLKDGLKLSSFTPHPDIKDEEVTGMQELAFTISQEGFQVSNSIDGNGFHPYDPNRMDRVLTLGDVDEWTLQSNFASHPFHIHVNPFQIVKITDPNGKDVSLPNAVDDAGCFDKDKKPIDGCKADPEYQGLSGVWKDTLWIKTLIPSPLPSGTDPKLGAYKIVLRTRYQRYIGEFVLHCHILDHEDQGMMQNVNIVLPKGRKTCAIK
ncbi:MAG TPA: multicopper oxidase family protein [Leptolyngbyaceae cyanobacterium]